MSTPVFSVDPRTGQQVEQVTTSSTPDDVTAVCSAAAAAAGALEALGTGGRAALLRAMAGELESDRETIVAVADRETALGPTRLSGELARTCFQLRLFADVLDEGSYLEATIDHADPDAVPIPRPDLRRMLVPVGPAAVFGASNFPLAFSVAGGDTSAALAAGCPVVVKAHSSHPGTARAVHGALRRAVDGTGAPAGTIGILYGHQAGAALVVDPHIRAVGFTGSLGGGRALFDLAAGRPDPIPFYGELGSLNPLFVTPAAAAERAEAIGQGFVGSYTLGHGQFCTKPGLALIPGGDEGKALRDAMVEATGGVAESWMLNGSIRVAYVEGVRRLLGLDGVELIAGAGASGRDGFASAPALVGVAAGALLDGQTPLLEECFGPMAVVAEYRDAGELIEVAGRLEGSLTATVHAAGGETELPARLLEILRRRVGRIVWNGFPTGVAVTWAMQHGGPYPSSTSELHTSVGPASIRRFLRPIAYQSAPEAVLPLALREGNPLAIPRRVDGVLRLP
jgi:NADP-dependent aldehyde dehydrogenase